MTTFLDGPAKGQNLMLRNARKFLRVTQSKNGFDALDAPGDEPRKDESLYAYEIAKKPSWCHIRSSKKGASGMYVIAEYRLCDPQPEVDVIMRHEPTWLQWCKNQVDPLPDEPEKNTPA